jgi:hypothetical protein
MKTTVWTLLILACAPIAGCDLFQTRDPQAPSQSNSTFSPPVSPDIVLSNLEAAIRDYNVDNYIRCFSDPAVRPYEFVPSQGVRANYPGLFSQWTLESERRYFLNLGTPKGGSPSLSFSNQQSLTVSSDSVIYNMNYILIFPHHRPNVPQSVQGNMQISIGSDNQHRWSIYRWQDFKTATDSTWSYWKAVFSGS